MRKKIRVLHVIPWLGMGGAERLVVNLSEALSENGIEVSVCSLYPGSGSVFEKMVEETGIPIYYLNKHKGFDPRMIFELHSLFARLKPDVVHTHLSVLRYSLLPAFLCGIPLRVHTVHNVAERETDSLGKIIRHLAFRLGKVIPVGVSGKVSETVKELYGINAEVIYNGIPVKRFRKIDNRHLRGKIYENVKDSDVVFIHIARFGAQKNHRLLISAFRRALRRKRNLKLLLVGDGELRNEMENIVKAENLERDVFFLGLRKDVPELLSVSDVFVLSSDWEGLPMTVLEAMAAGKPVISTSVGGVPELVKNNSTGILVPPGNETLLCEAMIRLADAPDLREKMGKNGQNLVSDFFDIDLSAKKYKELYLRMLGMVQK